MSLTDVFRTFGKGGLVCGYDVKAKDKNALDYILYMLDRTQSVFKYDGLPDTIPQRMLELFIQTNGNVAIAKVKGDVYAFTGGLGGKPDVYYRPTIYTVANPALSYSANLEIGKDCVVIPNDSLFIGLLPMFNRYAYQMVENDITLNLADINGRIMSLLTAPDDRSKKAAEEYIEKIRKGDMSVIAEQPFLDGIKVQPYAASGYSNQITQLIELQQYLKASWFNEIGLQANYNMKRESINSNEAQLNEDSLLPLIDDMLKCRRDALEKVNAMFNLDISVELASSWGLQHNEMALTHNDENNPEDEPGDDSEQSETDPADEPGEDSEQSENDPEEDKDEGGEDDDKQAG